MKITHSPYTPTEEVTISFCDMVEGEEGTIVQWHRTKYPDDTRVYVKNGIYYHTNWCDGLHGWAKWNINSDIQRRELLIKVRRRRV